MEYKIDHRQLIEMLRQSDELKNRLKSFRQLEENDMIEYPTEFVMFGFPRLKIQSEEELKGRINELKDLLGVELKKR